MTEFPDSEEAILVGFGENTASPRGKPCWTSPCPPCTPGEASQGQPPLAENLRLYVRGGGARVRHRPQRRGENHLLRQVAGELLGRPGHPGGLHAPDYGETVDQSQTPVEFLAKSWEKEELTRVKTYLGSMKYTPEEQEHTIQELSGGQKAKLFFLKM